MRLESSSAAGQLLEAMMTEVEPEFPLGICASLQNVKPEQQHARALLPTLNNLPGSSLACSAPAGRHGLPTRASC